MRYFLLNLLLLLVINSGIAQQHFSKGFSVSVGKHINNGGFNLTAHYHLNSFNELRLNLYQLKESIVDTNYISNTLPLKTTIVSVDYVVGFKPKKLLSTTLFLGLGFLTGKEKSSIEAYPSKNIYGVNLISELEIAPLHWFSFSFQFNYFVLNSAKTKPNLLSLKARFYFK